MFTVELGYTTASLPPSKYRVSILSLSLSHTHTHTHTHILWKHIPDNMMSFRSLYSDYFTGWTTEESRFYFQLSRQISLLSEGCKIIFCSHRGPTLSWALSSCIVQFKTQGKYTFTLPNILKAWCLIKYGATLPYVLNPNLCFCTSFIPCGSILYNLITLLRYLALRFSTRYCMKYGSILWYLKFSYSYCWCFCLLCVSTQPLACSYRCFKGL
jgi:hypothetical protein